MINAPSNFVKSQTPPWAQQNGDSLEQFLRLYYVWSEQEGFTTSDIRELIQNVNINKTREEYVKFFKQEFMQSLPENVLADKRLLIKHISEFYKARGTERSYKFLFNIVFGEEVSIAYPRDSLFITSAAQWNEDFSIFLWTTDEIDLSEINSVILKIGERNIIATPRSIRNSNNSLKELFFTVDTKIIGAVDSVVVGGSTYPVAQTIESIEVVQSATDFEIGQIYKVVTQASDIPLIKINNVSNKGRIKNVDVIRYAAGYTQTDIELYYVESTREDYLDNRTPTFGTFYDAFTLAQLGLTTTNETTLILRAGTFAKYKGFHNDIKGFTSDLSKLLDSDINQEFSYILQTNENFQSYAELIKSIVHPAGNKFAGERLFNTVLRVDLRLENFLSILRLVLEDFATATDGINTKHVDKNSVDYVVSDEFARYVFSKILLDASVATDDMYKDFFKVLADSSVSLDTIAKDFFKILYSDNIVSFDDIDYKDVIKLLESYLTPGDFNYFYLEKPTEDYVDSSMEEEKHFYKTSEDFVDALESSFKDFGKSLDDRLESLDEINKKDFDKAFAISSDAEDNNAFFMEKPLYEDTDTLDDYYKDFSKDVLDEYSVVDASYSSVYKVQFDVVDSADSYYKYTSKATEDDITTDDVLYRFLYKALSDEVTTDDYINDIFQAKGLPEDYFVANDEIASSFTKYLWTEYYSVIDDVALEPNKGLSSGNTSSVDSGGMALDPIYVGDPSDGDELNRRYWEYTYLAGEFTF